MNFLMDAHLPPSLAAWLRRAGHDVVHTSELPARNRTTDRTINQFSLKGRRVGVTKDTDFYYSHLRGQEPWKLVLVRTGNIGVHELKELFQKHLPAILQALKNHSLVELDRKAVRIVA